jgi:hypothetical protein
MPTPDPCLTKHLAGTVAEFLAATPGGHACLGSNLSSFRLCCKF